MRLTKKNRENPCVNLQTLIIEFYPIDIRDHPYWIPLLSTLNLKSMNIRVRTNFCEIYYQDIQSKFDQVGQ